jgi:ribokinase
VPAAGAQNQPRLTVVGSINLDLVFAAPRLPSLGETITGAGLRQIAGGKGANQAVAAARQGARVSLVGAVGADAFGAAALQALATEGIDTAAVVTCPGQPSGTAGIFVDGSGANAIVVAPGANAAVTPAQVEAACRGIDDCGFLICQLEIPLPAVAHAIGLARQRAVPVLLNAAPYHPLPDALLGLVDYLVLNETEAALLAGVPVADAGQACHAARLLRARGAGAVLVTMGSRGVQVCAAAFEQFLPARAVRAVDCTGAGDTFVGAFAVASCGGAALPDAVQYAQAAAALAVTRMGAQTSIPTHAEVQALLDQDPAFTQVDRSVSLPEDPR